MVTKSRIVFRPGYNWDNIPPSTVRHMIDRDELLKRLEAFKTEWIEVAGSLDKVTVNLSMVFDDFEAIIKGGSTDGQ